MATMVNVDDYHSLQTWVGETRKRLADSFAGPLLRDPSLARELNRQTDQILDAFLEALVVVPPGDLGLARLAGIGPDAATDFAQNIVSTGVESYDETVTPERILALADLYYAYNVERAGALRAVRTLQRLFNAGAVRLSTDVGAYGLYQFDKRDVLRFTADDRRAAYLRAFGYGSGPLAPGARPNTAFHGLFSGFMDQVSRYWRDKRISDVIRERADDPSFGSIAVVRRAGLDLRGNLRWASYGHLAVLTAEVTQVLGDAFQILDAPDVKSLFGAETAWDVVEEVLTRYFNEPLVTSARQRMGEAGREILRWLAQRYVLEQGRGAFEVFLENIADDAEEWLTSARSLGVTPSSPGTVAGAAMGPSRPFPMGLAGSGGSMSPAYAGRRNGR
jgi:hypothetical protein